MAKKATFDQGYVIDQQGDSRVVRFHGDGLPWVAYVVLPVGLIFILGGLAAMLPTSFWPLPVIILLGAGFLVYLAFQPQQFTLAPNAIIKGGSEYDLGLVSEILIDNPMDDDVAITGQPILVVGGTGVAGASVAAVGVMASATTSALTGASIAIGRSSAKRRFRVRIRYGKKVITLARNLKKDRAISIFNLLTGA
ncbi:MAG: hypothetical protein ACEPO2_01050 [Pelagibaca sp.]